MVDFQGISSIFAAVSYLTIIPRARMGSESIAHEAEGWVIDSEAMRARGIIVLVKSNQLVKNIKTKQL